MIHRHFVLLAAMFCVIMTSPARTEDSTTKRRPPNIVLILADDLGVDGIGCYGGLSYRTPSLDRLASQGIRFTHAYAQPLCTNTRIQVMTGKYNHRNWRAFGILDPKEPTFGHRLRAAGYATCIAGKWQLTSYDPPDYPGAGKRRGTGMHPKDAGFDEHCLWHTGHTELKGSRYADPVVLENGKLRSDLAGRYGEDVWTDFIADFMTRQHDRPFFVYYPMALPHAPFVPTPDSDEWKDPMSRHEKSTRYFRDMVEYLDKSVGRIVAKVDELGLGDDTLIVFFSDNGTPQQITSKTRNGPIRGGKGLTTDAGTHVPLIARWTGTTPSGRVCDDLVDSTDFLATFLDAAGQPLDAHPDIDSRSFLPQLRGEKGRPREWVFFHYDPRPGWDKDQFRLHRFARDRRFKLYDDGRLFDVPADRMETGPLARKNEPATASRARKRLGTVLESMKIAR